jgi:Uri superfamily endonuclease
MKGVYVLVVSVAESVCVRIGSLGRMSFRRGLYAYVGSGQVGLEKRVARHLRRVKKRFWHIDYLLGSGVARVVGVFWEEGEKSEECRVAGVLGERGVPVVGFGCSDCRCKSHLFRIRGRGFLAEFIRELCLKSVRSVC